MTSLAYHLENSDPFQYNSLPIAMQKDKGTAIAAIRGMFGRIMDNYFGDWDRISPDASLSFLDDDYDDDYGNFGRKTYQRFRDFVTNIFNYQPTALTVVNQRFFRFVVKGICEVDNTFSSTLLPYLDKLGSHDDISRLQILSWIWDILVPVCVLNEEHFIAVAYKQNDPEEDVIVPLRLNDIPERFIKCRLFLSNYENAEGFRLMPRELFEDKEFCLSYFRSTKLSPLYSEYHTAAGWKWCPENFRKDKRFYAQAVFRNISVLHVSWKDGQFNAAAERRFVDPSEAFEETPLEVFLSAIKGHGYKKTVINRDYEDPRVAVDIYDKKIKSELDRYDEYMILLSGIVQSRRENCRCAFLRPIDFGDVETSIGIKKRIASYVGVPTGQFLVDLREVSKLRLEFQDELIAYVQDNEIGMSETSDSFSDHNQEENDDDMSEATGSDFSE